MKSLGMKRTLSFDIRPTVLYILGRSLLLRSELLVRSLERLWVEDVYYAKTLGHGQLSFSGVGTRVNPGIFYTKGPSSRPSLYKWTRSLARRHVYAPRFIIG